MKLQLAKKSSVWLLFLLASSYVLGLFTYRNELFPLDLYRSVVRKHFSPEPESFTPPIQSSQSSQSSQPITNPNQTAAETGQDVVCPVANRRSATPLKNLRSVSSLRNYNMMLGDSLILHMFDPRFYGLSDWVAVGQGSQTTKCLVSELDWFLDLDPKMVFLYIGGNDVDRGISPTTICSNMSSIVKRFTDTRTRLVLSEIHYGLDSRRRARDVRSVNGCINKIAKQFNLPVIPTLLDFKFENELEAFALSVDGEHLNHEGYRLWISHLKPILEEIQRHELTSEASYLPKQAK